METASVSSSRSRRAGASPLPLPRAPLVARVRSRRVAAALPVGASPGLVPPVALSPVPVSPGAASPPGLSLVRAVPSPFPETEPPALAAALRAGFARATREALAWAAFVGAHAPPSGRPLAGEALYRKAVEALAFTATAHARHFAVPSKLAGTGACAAAVRELAALPPVPYRPLFALATESGLSVGYLHPSGCYVTLGRVQDKHAAWVRPLLPCGLRLYLLQVTGLARANATLGVNVAFGHVAAAIAGAAALDAERAAEAAAAEVVTTVVTTGATASPAGAPPVPAHRLAA